MRPQKTGPHIRMLGKTAIASYSSDLLHAIGFIPVLPSTWLWALMLVTWFVALIVTPRFYR